MRWIKVRVSSSRRFVVTNPDLCKIDNILEKKIKPHGMIVLGLKQYTRYDTQQVRGCCLAPSCHYRQCT